MIAFIDQDFRVGNIADIKPYSLETYWSAGPVPYALNVNQGWFAPNGVRPGDLIYGGHLGNDSDRGVGSAAEW